MCMKFVAYTVNMIGSEAMSGYLISLIDEGGERDQNAIQLGTRQRRYIRNLMIPEASPDELREDLEKFQRAHPEAIVRSVTATYNCVGMVFATRRTWIDPNEVRKFLEDDGYRRLRSLDNADIGDVVIYKDKTQLIQHVGIVASRKEDIATAQRSFVILSKWSICAEFLHKPDDVPEAWGILDEVWTDRKEL